MALRRIQSPSLDNNVFVNLLLQMGKTVEQVVEQAMEALLTRNEALAQQVLQHEPRIDALEVIVDEMAVRLLDLRLTTAEIRMVVSGIKINKDLERMGDLAVNIAQRVLLLRDIERAQVPDEMIPLASLVKEMLRKALRSLRAGEVTLAKEVIASDDKVDRQCKELFDHLLAAMSHDPWEVRPGVQLILAVRYLERIADHSTNIAEDVIFWACGVDVRHGRNVSAATKRPPQSERAHSCYAMPDAT